MKLCDFCGAHAGTTMEPFCSARTLIPGERFPHEFVDSDAPSSSDRYGKFLAKRAEQRSRGIPAGTRKRR